MVRAPSNERGGLFSSSGGGGADLLSMPASDVSDLAPVFAALRALWAAPDEFPTSEYPGTRSSFDRDASIQLGNLLGRGDPLAGLILDADGIRTFKGHDQSMDGNLGRCAY